MMNYGTFTRVRGDKGYITYVDNEFVLKIEDGVVYCEFGVGKDKYLKKYKLEA